MNWVLLTLIVWASMSDSILAQTHKKRLVCYFAKDNEVRAVQAFNNRPSSCTHLIYGFGSIDTATSTIIDQGSSTYASFLALKAKAKNTKFMIAIDGSAPFVHLTSNSQRTDAFVSSIVTFLTKYGLDGFDLDWEFPTAADRGNFIKLLTALKNAFAPRRFILSAATTGSASVLDKGYDVPAMDKILDFYSVMAYNYHTISENVVNKEAPLFQDGPNNVNHIIQHYIRSGATKSKMNLGIHFFGPSWTLSTRKTTPGSPAVTGSGVDMPYSTICSNIRNGWIVVKDPTKSSGPYAFSRQTMQWVGFDDPEMARVKVKYALTNKLGGIHVFEMSQDDIFDVCKLGTSPLLTTIHQTLGN